MVSIRTNYNQKNEGTGFCRACFNYWVHCDCVGDLMDDRGHPNIDENDEKDDNAIGLANTPLVNIAKDLGLDLDKFIPTPAKGPNRDGWVNGRKPIPKRPSPYHLPKPIKKTKRNPLDPKELFPQNPKYDRIVKPPLDETPYDSIPDDIEEQLIDSLSFPDDATVQYDDLSGMDPLVDLTDVDNWTDQTLPKVMTPDEVNDALFVSMLTGVPFEVPVGAVFNIPSLEELGYLPYTISRTYAAEVLQKIPGVPQFYGTPRGPNGEYSTEYKTWYFEKFIPWFDSTTPYNKWITSGLICVSPPPDPNKTHSLAGQPDVYVSAKIGGPDGEGDSYHWKKNGKQYETKGRFPSITEIFFPERFPGLVKRNPDGTPRSVVIGQVLSGRKNVHPMLHYKVQLRHYIFPDSVESVFVPPVLNTFIPPRDADMKDSIINIDRGDGSDIDVFYPKSTGGSDLWKYASYQVANQVAGTYSQLLTDPDPTPFYGGTRYYFGPFNGSRRLYFHNHLPPGNKPSHIMCKFSIRLFPTQGIPELDIRAVGVGNVFLPIVLNFPKKVSEFVIAPALGNGFTRFTGDIDVSFGVYITPQQNNGFQFTNNSLILDIATREQGTTTGVEYELLEASCWRNLRTKTPGFEPDTAATTSVNYNNLGTNLRVSNTGSSASCTVLNALSDPSGQNVINQYSKVWIKNSGDASNLIQGTLTTAFNSRTLIPGEWMIYPLLRIAQSAGGFTSVTQNVLQQPNGAGKFVYVYRVQHVNISQDWSIP